MKILIVSKYYPPRNAVASLRPYSWAKNWVREGHDVTVITGRSASAPCGLTLPDAGCTVTQVPLSPLVATLKRSYSRLAGRAGGALPARTIIQTVDAGRKRFGAFGAGPRMPDITGHSWAAGAFDAAMAGGPWDVVVSTAAPYVTHGVAARLKRSGQARSWIADYRDLWTDHHGSIGLPVVRAWERRYEDWLMRDADAITTVSAPLADVLGHRHGPKVHLIENGVDAEDYEALDSEPVFEADGKLRIVYTGTVYEQQDATPLFQALAEMRREPEGAALASQLEIVFATRSSARVAREVRRHGVSDLVRVLRFQPRPLALRMQRDADLLLFLPWNNPAADGILTGKVYEYLVSGTPILMVGGQALEASQRLILNEGHGFRRPDAPQIKLFLENLLRGHQPRPKQARIILERYDRRYQALKLLRLASRLTAERQPVATGSASPAWSD